jgi:hypothetical protein
LLKGIAGDVRTDGIIPAVLNCTPVVADVRTLRAAAFTPYVLGLTLLIVAVPLSYATDDKSGAARFLAGSLVLFVTASLIKRGSLIATVVLAVCFVGLVMLALVGLAHETRAEDVLVGSLGLVVTGGICWLATRAVAASWRLKRFPWLRQRAGIRSTINELPKDRRIVKALSPLAASLAVYGGGCVAAIIVGFATGISLVAGLALVPFALVGSRLLQRARRTLALHVEEVRARDPRRPVLLVRSFADDNLELEPQFEYFGSLFRKRLTLEEFIVSHLLTLGPVVAIGKPHEGLSPLGAAREYVFGPGWQDRVSTVLDECSWVVAILGGSEGLVWEYEQIIRRGIADRLMLVFPPATPQVVRQRWDVFRTAFPPAQNVELPLRPQTGVPLCALFPKGAPPVLFCSRYQNETAYSVVLAMLLARVTSR